MLACELDNAKAYTTNTYSYAGTFSDVLSFHCMSLLPWLYLGLSCLLSDLSSPTLVHLHFPPTSTVHMRGYMCLWISIHVYTRMLVLASIFRRGDLSPSVDEDDIVVGDIALPLTCIHTLASFTNECTRVGIDVRNVLECYDSDLQVCSRRVYVSGCGCVGNCVCDRICVWGETGAHEHELRTSHVSAYVCISCISMLDCIAIVVFVHICICALRSNRKDLRYL